MQYNGGHNTAPRTHAGNPVAQLQTIASTTPWQVDNGDDPEDTTATTTTAPAVTPTSMAMRRQQLRPRSCDDGNDAKVTAACGGAMVLYLIGVVIGFVALDLISVPFFLV